MIRYVLSYKSMYLPVDVQRNGSGVMVISFYGLLCLPHQGMCFFKKFFEFHICMVGEFQVMLIPSLG